MERYVVSLGLAERLKLAGYPQKALHVWTNFNFEDWTVEESDAIYDYGEVGEAGTMVTESCSYQNEMDCGSDDVIAAPLSDELTEQIPRELIIFKASSGMYRAGEISLEPGGNLVLEPFTWEQYNKRADAAARLWLYCKEHELLKSEA